MIKRYLIGFVILCVIGLIWFGITKKPTTSRLPQADLASDKIAFVAEIAPSGLSEIFLTEHIYMINVDRPGLTHVIQRSGIDRGITWSPLADKIAYYEYDTKSLYTINVDGSNQPEVLWRGNSILDSTWSPDGSMIAFTQGRVISLLEIDTKQVTPLTDETITSSTPTWSPEGNRLAFSVGLSSTENNQPKSGLGIINIDGSDFVYLDFTQRGWDPAWSPIGDQIAFVQGGDIYVIDLRSSDLRSVTQGEEATSPTWSPDGTRIAFVSLRNAQCGSSFADGPKFCSSELYVVNADGSNKTLIRSQRNEFIRDPIWSPRN